MVAAVCEMLAGDTRRRGRKAHSKGKPWENAERVRSSFALYVGVDGSDIIWGG